MENAYQNDVVQYNNPASLREAHDGRRSWTSTLGFRPTGGAIIYINIENAKIIYAMYPGKTDQIEPIRTASDIVGEKVMQAIG